MEEKLTQIAIKPYSIASFHIMNDFYDELSSFLFHGTTNVNQIVEACSNCQEFLEFWYSIFVSLRSRLSELGLIINFGVGYYFEKIPYFNQFSSLFIFNERKSQIENFMQQVFAWKFFINIIKELAQIHFLL